MESNDQQDSHAVMKSPKENLMTVGHIEKNKFMLVDILGRISSTVREKLLANINIFIMLSVSDSSINQTGFSKQIWSAVIFQIILVFNSD